MVISCFGLGEGGIFPQVASFGGVCNTTATDLVSYVRLISLKVENGRKIHFPELINLIR